MGCGASDTAPKPRPYRVPMYSGVPEDPYSTSLISSLNLPQRQQHPSLPPGYHLPAPLYSNPNDKNASIAHYPGTYAQPPIYQQTHIHESPQRQEKPKKNKKASSCKKDTRSPSPVRGYAYAPQPPVAMHNNYAPQSVKQVPVVGYQAGPPQMVTATYVQESGYFNR